MVAITGNVPAALIGKDAFQEIDINGITLPMTKHNYLVRDADDLPRVVAEAFHIARSGRPGPVHIDITKDALQQETKAEHPTEEDIVAGLPGFRPNLEGHGRQLKLAVNEIAAAKRPVILAGHGVLHAEAWDELKAFAEKTSIPVAWTLLGIGAMDETHPLAYGYMGMHGWKHVNRAIQSADLLIAIGMRFDDRVTGNVRTYAPYARIVHADIDPAEIGKNVAVEVPIVRGATGCCRPTTSSSGSASSATTVPRTWRTSARTRCGWRATRASASPTSTCRLAASGRWASASPRRWAPRWDAPTARPGRSPATVGSR
jgi:acetolactate synthase-1/2/3 large subunit